MNNSHYELLDVRRLSNIYSVYRFAIALILLFLFFVTLNDPIIGKDEPLLFAIVSISYLFVSVILVFVHVFIKRFSFLQRVFGIIIDVATYSLMLIAHGAASIQITILFLVMVVASFILLRPKQAIAITLLSIICVVYQQFYFIWIKKVYIQAFSDIILLTISFFGTATFSHFITSRLKSTEIIANKQAKQVAKLNVINQKIIETIQNGILVINNQHDITLMNQAAQNMLAIQYLKLPMSLSNIDSHLYQNIKSNIESNRHNTIYQPISSSKIKESIALQVYNLSENEYLIFLEAVSKNQKKAQQLKLASLGRLTASIAHEIRNPIGAISQASQLLEEIDDDNSPIYKIIHKQTQRVNQIIEDIMQLSRPTQAQVSNISVGSYINEFVNNHYQNDNIDIQITSDTLLTFNEIQLEQVLINLVGNALKHGHQSNPDSNVKILTHKIKNTYCIDIIDNGEGVSVVNQEKLFEPFFTTSKTGTGLGLYLSKAFCEANGANLEYIHIPAGSCFRISKIEFSL